MDKDIQRILELGAEAALGARDGRVVYANENARRLLGGDCAGESVQALLGPEVAELTAPSFLTAAPCRGRSFVIRSNLLDGERLYFLSVADESFSMVNQPFLYALHNSLMNQQLSCEGLRPHLEDLGDETGLGYLRDLTVEHFKLLRLAGNARTLLSFQEGGPVFRPLSVDLGSYVSLLLDGIEPYLVGRSITRRLSELTVAVDPALFKSLFLNLLSNALLHGGGSVLVDLSEGESQVYLTVSDTGRGIPDHELPHVFDRYRSGPRLDELNRGAGFGLSICRQVARLHGGTLLLESREGRGCTVRVSLSRKTAAAEARQYRAEELCSFRDLQIGLADSLPVLCYGERYMD